MNIYKKILLILFLVYSTYNFIHAEEKILSFDSDISINVDGSMVVTETIKVKAENSKIKRGIYRDFPTEYKDRLGNFYKVDFNVLSLKRDNLSEAYHLKKQSNGQRIYFGSSSVFLEPGVYTYILTYKTNRQLGFFKKHDELYWNVTGNGWDFTIDKASATIRLPEAIESVKMSLIAYTGYQGEQGDSYISKIIEPGVSFFETTKPLPPKNGITTVTAWPKGVIHEPTSREKAQAFLSYNRHVLIGFGGLFVLLVYFYFVWFLYGRDPGAGVIYPRYKPPSGYSPDVLRYIKKMGYDDKTFTSALINMARKGLIKVIELKFSIPKEFELQRTNKDKKLSAHESAVLYYLFKEKNFIYLKNENYKVINKAKNSHKRYLRSIYKNKYFYTNTWLYIIGVLFAIAICFITFAEVSKSGYGMIIALIVIVSAAVICWVFHRLLKAPTKASRKTLDEVDGFIEYMKIAEGQEIKHTKLTNAPKLNVDLFEKYLPYAIALDVEQDWAEKFTRVFARLTGEDRNHSPSWYDGSSYNTINISKFASSLGTSMSATISSSSHPPGSSSGGGGFSGGGGGSSGGGGGGGGGGGW